MFTQGWANFKKEFQQLRRSFRFNEYQQITAANPPKNPVTKVAVVGRFCERVGMHESRATQLRFYSVMRRQLDGLAGKL